MLLKEECTVSDFEDSIPFSFFKLERYDIEYIGGQNRSFILLCRESFLHSRSLSRIIQSYAPVPLIARLHPSLLPIASDALNTDSDLSVSITFHSDVSLGSFKKLSPSSALFSSINSEISTN